jgi:hypothetical protein
MALIAEALAQLRDMEAGIIEEAHLQQVPSFVASKELRRAVKEAWSKPGGGFQPPASTKEKQQRNKIICDVAEGLNGGLLRADQIKGRIKREKQKVEEAAIGEEDRWRDMVRMEFTKFLESFLDISNRAIGISDWLRRVYEEKDPKAPNLEAYYYSEIRAATPELKTFFEDVEREVKECFIAMDFFQKWYEGSRVKRKSVPPAKR